MVAKIKSSFLKNSFQLFCYKNLLSKDPNHNSSSLEEDLKRLSNSSPNLSHQHSHQSRKQTDKKRHNKENTQIRSSSSHENSSHRSLVNSKLSKKKQNDLIILSDSDETNENLKAPRSKSTSYNVNNNVNNLPHENFKLKILKAKNNTKHLDTYSPSSSSTSTPSPVSTNHYANFDSNVNTTNTAVSSLYNKNSIANLKLAKKIQIINKQTNTTQNAPIYAKSSILQTDKRRFLSSANAKKAVRFADALGLELESVITVNNQLDNTSNPTQMRTIRIPNSPNLYSQIAYNPAPFSQSNYFSVSPSPYAEFFETNFYQDDGLNLYDQVIDHIAFDGMQNTKLKTTNNFEDQYDLIVEKQMQYLNNQSNYFNSKMYNNNENGRNEFLSDSNQRMQNNSNAKVVVRQNNGNSVNSMLSLAQNSQPNNNITITTRINNGKLESEV